MCRAKSIFVCVCVHGGWYSGEGVLFPRNRTGRTRMQSCTEMVKSARLMKVCM